MSTKTLIFIGIVGLTGYALQKNAPPVEPGTVATDSVAVHQAGFGARLEYGVGRVGSKVVGGSVNRMVGETEQSLADMKVTLKNAKGSEGTRARDVAKKVVTMNEKAKQDLEYGHPIKAVRGAMEAQSLINSVRAQLNRG